MRIVVSHFLSAINEDMITIKQLQTSQSVIISNVCHELTYADDVESREGTSSEPCGTVWVTKRAETHAGLEDRTTTHKERSSSK